VIELISPTTASAIDRATIESGVSSVELMRRVAQGVLENVPLKEGRTLIVAGKGGNGGDGYALYLLMKERGMDVTLVDFGESRHNGSRALRELVRDNIVLFSENLDFSEYSNIIDCIFGVGLSREISGEYRNCINKINASSAFVVSVDIPSGLSADSGRILGTAVEADVTIAVQKIKFGHFLSDGLDVCGDVGALDIGLKDAPADMKMIEESDVRSLFPPLKRNVHKGTMGRLAVIAGSESYSGASVLAELGAAAFALGDGLVKLCVPDCILYPVMSKITECTLLSMPSDRGALAFNADYLQKATSGASAVLFGNGVDLTDDTRKILEYLVRNVTVPLVLDADGLNLLAVSPELLRERAGKTVLTPHPKELSRLMGLPMDEILSDPVSYAQEFAARYGVVLMLKGASTIVTDGKETFLSATGCSGMAKGGSGDLLAGAVAALIAGGRGPIVSAYGASYILGLAGEAASLEKGDYSMLPTDTASKIASVVNSLSARS